MLPGACVIILANEVCRAVYQDISLKVSLALRQGHKRKDSGIVYESPQNPLKNTATRIAKLKPTGSIYNNTR